LILSIRTLKLRIRLLILAFVLLVINERSFAEPITSINQKNILEDLIVQAVSNYPSVKSRKILLDASRTDLLASKLKFLPTFSITAAESNVSNSSTNASSANSYNTLTLSLPLYSGGATIAGYQKAQSQLTSADYALRETKDDVAKKVIISYSEWYKAYLKLKILDQTDKDYLRLLELITHRYDSGVSSKSEVDLAKSRINQNKVEIKAQRQATLNAISTLGQLVGEGRLDVGTLDKSIPFYADLPLREIVLNYVLDNNPTIKRLESDTLAADADAKIARAQSLPQLVFQAQQQSGNPYVTNAPGISSYGLVLQYSTDSGFASIATSQSAFKRAQSTLETVETTKREVIQMLHNEYNDYEYTRSKLIDLEEVDNLGIGLSESYSRQYLAGKKSWMDVMNIIREKTQNKAVLADAQANLIASSWKIFIYMNGLDVLEAKYE